MKKDIDVKKLFCELTSHTYPDGKEKEMFHLLPEGVQEDEFGNKFMKVGENSNTMFCSHLDTATSAYTKVNHVFDGKFIKTDGKSILGADDKAGTVIMMYMIHHKVPGLYYFFLAEEVGCQGSKKLAAKWKENKELFGKINKVVAFDRKAYKSIITHQFGRTCSDEFAKDLAKKYNDLDTTFVYEADPTGLYTDSAQFKTFIPECTNISVGYYDQHTMQEKQDIEFLEKVCKASVKIDWDKLIIKRDPDKDNDYGNRSNHHHYYDDGDYNYNSNRGSSSNNSSYTQNWGSKHKPKDNSVEVEYWYDDKFQYLSEFHTKGKSITEVKISDERIAYETKLISQIFHYLEIEFTDLVWDGIKLEVNTKQRETASILNREDLYEFLPELKYV